MAAVAVGALVVAVAAVAAVVAAGFLRLVWHLAGRPLAVALGRVEPTADDFVVQGWQAERGGEWADALAAYDEARRRGRRDDEVAGRRADLLRRCPALAGEAALAELEWLATLDPLDVLGRLGGDAPSGRKSRLVSVACCRRVWHLLPDDRLRAAVEAAERHADRPLPPEEAVAVEMASAEAVAALEDGGEDIPRVAHAAAWCLALWADASRGAVEVIRLTADAAGRGEQVRLLGCVFGLPDRTREAAPEWRTDTALALARGVYEGRDFSAMPILADALQDAGCERADVLAHCRGPGPHCRGCWVVDLLLGKE